jgi:saccharopine dehydrogenase-like NADP-dependent oxidoreductase
VKFLVLGAGKMGYAVAYDLIRGTKVEKVVVADSNTENLKELVKRLPDEKIIPVELDVTNEEELAQLMAEKLTSLSAALLTSTTMNWLRLRLQQRRTLSILAATKKLSPKSSCLTNWLKNRV